ncbi:hypothetical protein [Roseovarius phycicola]|uniref:Glyceraldehyde-3-phosphate dehydrogenase n=1 Tax=Roseovarius phycicola TaxID=3080976 RepID=A0ABZ2HBQ9_9RHOB
MTNKTALFLGALVLIALLIDIVFLDMNGSLFLSRKLVDFIEWLKFWR